MKVAPWLAAASVQLRGRAEKAGAAIQRSRSVGPVVLAVCIGLLAAAWAILFRWLIALVQNALLDRPVDFLGGVLEAGFWQRLPLLLGPLVGMPLVVLMVSRWAPEARGHGVPEVQHAVRHRSGRMRGRVVLVKAAASALTIGSGGSVGREGPIVQVGASLGSSLGQLLRLGPEQLKLLVACGAAGGIAATFNAPIAGVLFALEVILGDFAARSFGLVVIAAVSARALSGAVLGSEPAFQIAQGFSLNSQREFFLYPVLGVVLGLAAVGYIRSVTRVEGIFDRWQVRPVTKGLAAGLLIGVIGLLGGGLVFGVGYGGVELALTGRLTLAALIGFAALKMLATSITLGGGGSGGVFAPALFIGSMVGGAFGTGANLIFPEWVAPAGAYALVGMAGLFGAAAHAPITSVLILFEMTDNYAIILPLMLTVGLSYLVASSVSSESLYSVKLKKLAEGTELGREGSVLDLLLVADAMTDDVETVPVALSIAELAELARGRRTRSWPVLDDGGELAGIVTGTDLERALLGGTNRADPVGTIMTTALVTLRPDDTLRTAFRLFSERDVQQIPVVEDPTGKRLIGVLKRYEMVWAFKTVREEHDRLLAAKGTGRPLATEEVVQIQVPVHRGGARFSGRRVRDLDLPEGVLISLVRRAGRPFVPRGDALIRAGDILVVLTTQDREAAFREWLKSGTA